MRVSYLGANPSASFITSNSVQIPLYRDSSKSKVLVNPDEADEGSNALAIKYSPSIFFVRVKGDSLEHLGIHSDDVLVIDRSLAARDGDVVITTINGEMTVTTLELDPEILIRPRNTGYAPRDIEVKTDIKVSGVVTSILREQAVEQAS